MKHKILLNSFMFLALLSYMSATLSFASEVTGNLSSSGNNENAQTTQSKPTNPGAQSSNGGANGTPDNGTLAGNVSASFREASPESENGGEVLGAQDINYESSSVSEDTFFPLSDDGSYTNYEPSQTATAFGSASLFSPSDWFWIITLLLLLIAVVTYIYNHDKELARRTELHY